jgi:riboflavin kinase/FMN adenylyltransferase
MSAPFPICRDGEPVPAALKNAAVAIGNFDGVHRGHQALIEAARGLGSRAGHPCAVLTFEPHPRTFFNPDARLFRLTPEPVKLELLHRFGADGVFLRRFDAALASLSAEAFVAEFLVGRLGVSAVAAGHDFHFGRGREGTPARLVELCRAHGLDCALVPAVCAGGEVVSSSAIRSALEAGDVAKANDGLGYRWFVRAEVRHGDKRGRQLGYPTANLRLSDDSGLRHGIYAVRAGLQGRVFGAVASFGRRPTFDNGAPLLEVHLFDFAGDLYGRTLDVELLGRIRGEERFDSAEALVAQMDRDAGQARTMLAENRVRSMIG